MGSDSGLIVVPITALVSVFLVLTLNAAAGTAIKSAANIYAREIPPQIRSTVVDALADVIGPVAQFSSWVCVQQIAVVAIAVPFLMSCIDDLESVKGLNAEQKKEVDAARARAIVARQTINRTGIFIIVALMVTVLKVKRNATKTVQNVISLVEHHM